jgi:hypothetical protein
VRALSRLKDAALQKGLLFFLRPKLKRYGELRDLTLDTSNKILTAEIDLLGDPTPLVISQARYDLQKQGEGLFLIVQDVKVSKPWIQNLIEDHLPEVRLKVPDSMRGLLKRLL